MKKIWRVLIASVVLIAGVALVLCISGNRPGGARRGSRRWPNSTARWRRFQYRLRRNDLSVRTNRLGRVVHLRIATEDSGDFVTLGIGESAPIPGIGTVTVHNVRIYRCGAWTDVVLIIDESERGK